MGNKTLRDEFAVEAMKILMSEGTTISVHTEDGILEMPRSKAVPKLAYGYADAMLAERENQ